MSKERDTKASLAAMHGAPPHVVRAMRADPDTLAATHAAFHATDAAWSAAIEADYGRAGSLAYDRARYRTAPADYTPRVRSTYEAREAARQAWEAARGMTPAKA